MSENEPTNNITEQPLPLPTKRKRGRPPKSESGKKEGLFSKIKPKNKEPKKESDFQDEGSIDPSLFADSFIALFSIIDESISKRNEKLALRLTEDEKFAKTLGQDSLATNQEKKALHNSCKRMAMKYSLLNKFGDEAVIIGVCLTYGYRQIQIKNNLVKIANIIRQNKVDAQNSGN